MINSNAELGAAAAEKGFKVRGLRWVIIALVFFATLINYIDRLTISVLAPLITKELNLSNTEFGGIATWFLFAYTISQALSGKLYDKIGIKKGFTSKPRKIVSYLHSDTAITQCGSKFVFETGSPSLLVELIQPTGLETVIEKNILTAPGRPGSVDKGEPKNAASASRFFPLSPQ